MEFDPPVLVMDGSLLRLKSDTLEFQHVQGIDGVRDYFEDSNDVVKISNRLDNLRHRIFYSPYLVDYECTSKPKKFRHAGIFPVSYYLPDSHQLTSTNITVNVKDGKFIFKLFCQNKLKLKILKTK